MCGTPRPPPPIRPHTSGAEGSKRAPESPCPSPTATPGAGADTRDPRHKSAVFKRADCAPGGCPGAANQCSAAVLSGCDRPRGGGGMTRVFLKAGGVGGGGSKGGGWGGWGCGGHPHPLQEPLSC